jgi:hypothetical protein
MIDPAVNNGWFEIFEATNESATSIQDLFHNTLLACYLQHQLIVFDNGNKAEFKPDVAKANAIIERVHKVEQSE